MPAVTGIPQVGSFLLSTKLMSKDTVESCAVVVAALSIVAVEVAVLLPQAVKKILIETANNLVLFIIVFFMFNDFNKVMNSFKKEAEKRHLKTNKYSFTR